ncbi:MAG: hypothetical protein JRH11_25015, partial [Deltaproteobacteria bacterium]|nr:hypothetical protein [Deltaproteobacteria bacterium]
VNQPNLGNTLGIALSGGTNRAIRIVDNAFHGMGARSLRVDGAGGFLDVAVTNNSFVQTTTDPCLVAHDGTFSNVAYSGNSYFSSAAADAWFCVDGARQGAAAWEAASGEAPGAASDTVADAGRNLDRYAAHLSLGDSLGDFAAAARTQSRHSYRPELDATNAAAYIRAGF